MVFQQTFKLNLQSTPTEPKTQSFTDPAFPPATMHHTQIPNADQQTHVGLDSILHEQETKLGKQKRKLKNGYSTVANQVRARLGVVTS